MPYTSFTAPSGQVFGPMDLALIRELEQNKTVSWSENEVTFNSGFKSHVYFQARNDLSYEMRLLEAVGERIRAYVTKLPATNGPQCCLIGIPVAGTQLAQAAAHASRAFLGPRMSFVTLRTHLKRGHGKDNTWAGHPYAGSHSYVTVENVVSTAKAYLEHLEHLEEDGYPTRNMHHVAFADWELGGIESLIQKGYQRVHALYKMRDMIAALVHMGIWTPSYYDVMHQRIEAWRAANVKQAA